MRWDVSLQLEDQACIASVCDIPEHSPYDQHTLHHVQHGSVLYHAHKAPHPFAGNAQHLPSPL